MLGRVRTRAAMSWRGFQGASQRLRPLCGSTFNQEIA
jgi:hypothetical protein